MNILEHILAGHYPVDDKGRALVPMRGGLTATILATDPHGDTPIAGWGASMNCTSWTAAGRWEIRDHHNDLLPPPPRKVKALGVIKREQYGWVLETVDFDGAKAPPVGTVIAVNGEHEEPWS